MIIGKQSNSLGTGSKWTKVLLCGEILQPSPGMVHGGNVVSRLGSLQILRPKPLIPNTCKYAKRNLGSGLDHVGSRGIYYLKIPCLDTLTSWQLLSAVTSASRQWTKNVHLGLRRLSALGCRGVYLPALTRIQFFETHPHPIVKKIKVSPLLTAPHYQCPPGTFTKGDSQGWWEMSVHSAGWEQFPWSLMMDHDNPGNPLNKKLAQGESLHLMIKKIGASECSIVFRWSFPLKTPGSRSPWRWAPSMDWKFPLGTWGIKCRVQYKIQPWHLWKTTERKLLDVEAKELTVNF